MKPAANSSNKILSALSIAAVVLLGASCSGSSAESASPDDAAAATTTSTPAESALSVQDATVLSRLLFNNFDKAGADVFIDVPFGLQSSIDIEAVVDWKNHFGRGEMRVIGADGAVIDSSTVYWRDLYDPQRGIIATTLKGLPEAMAEQGRSGVEFVARPFSESSPLDRVLRYLDGLATAQAENPLLLRQDDKAKSFGAQSVVMVDGSSIDTVGLRYGKSRYWADAQSGLLIQATAPLAGLAEETRFRFSAHGPRTIELPPADRVVDAADIPQIYQRLTERK